MRTAELEVVAGRPSCRPFPDTAAQLMTLVVSIRLYSTRTYLGPEQACRLADTEDCPAFCTAEEVYVPSRRRQAALQRLGGLEQ